MPQREGSLGAQMGAGCSWVVALSFALDAECAETVVAPKPATASVRTKRRTMLFFMVFLLSKYFLVFLKFSLDKPTGYNIRCIKL
jgi:hypothetical protein